MTTSYVPGCALLPTDFTSASYRALLVAAPFVPDPLTQEFVADVAADELGGAGYSRQVLAGKTITPSVADNIVTFDCNDPNFGSVVAGETATYMIVFRFVTNDADSELVCALNVDRTTDGSPVIITIPATGIVEYRGA